MLVDYKQSPSIEGLFFAYALINKLHGGLWNFVAGSGLAAVALDNSRVNANASIGFRPAFAS